MTTTTRPPIIPESGGSKFPENRENNREFKKSEVTAALLHFPLLHDDLL
jgi:hypothetical protein